MDTTKRPFTAALHRIRARGSRYEDLPVLANHVRSSTWFWTLMNRRDPWAVEAPPRSCFEGLQELFEVSEEILREWIAVEWYGVAPDRLSVEARKRAHAISRLSAESTAAIDVLVDHLAAIEGSHDSESPALSAVA